MRAGWLPIMFASLLPLPAAAQRALLDDAPSPQQLYSMEVEWQPQEIARAVQMLFANRNADVPPLTGRLQGVQVLLDTRRYVGRDVRIYLRLPTAMPGAENVGGIELSWIADGRFLDGSVSPGQEALLFEGRVDEAIVGGVLDFRLSIDAAGIPERFNLEPLYEIEVIS